MAPAEGLSAPGPRARGPPPQLPAPSRGAPGQGPAGQRPGSRGPRGRRGRSHSDPPPFASPWGVGGAEPSPTPAEEAPEAMYPHPYSHHRAGLLRVLPAPLPEPLGPSPASAPHPSPPHFRGSGCGCKRDSPPSPFSSIKPLGAASGATEPPLPHLVPAAPPSSLLGRAGDTEGRGQPLFLGSEAMTQFLIQSGLLRALPSAGFDALPPSWVSAGAGGP